jgi:hypothetical protein
MTENQSMSEERLAAIDAGLHSESYYDVLEVQVACEELFRETVRLRAENERLAKALAWIVAFNESSETECRLCRGIFHRPECPMPLAYRALNPAPTSSTSED